MFTFLAPRPQAQEECEALKTELTNVLAQTRHAAAAAAATPAPSAPLLAPLAPPAPVKAVSTPVTAQPAAGPLRTPAATPRPAMSRAVSTTASEARGTPGPSGGELSISDFRLRKKVMMKHPDIGSLHKELVMSGQITEAEFWEGREVRLCPSGSYTSHHADVREDSTFSSRRQRKMHRRKVDRARLWIHDRRFRTER